MKHSPRPSRPAVAPCAALLAGVACGSWLAGHAQALTVVAVVLGVLAWGAPSRGVARRFLGLALCLCLGAGLDVRDRHAAQVRGRGWLPPPGQSVELHVVGRVAGAPEVGPEGQRRLLVRGHPERGGRDAVDALSIALRVQPSPDEATRGVDKLRRGDRVRVWCRLRVPRGYANPGTRAAADSLRARGLDAFGTVKSARLVEQLSPGRDGPLRGLDMLSRFARRRLEREFAETPDVHSVVAAMLVGERGKLDERLVRRLRDGGLIHLIAISGLHVGLAVVPLLGLLRRARLAGWLRLPLLIVLLSGFALGVGPRPSVTRAVLACMIAFGGRCLGRGGDGLNTLALLAAALVVLRPGLLWDPGYQLTFLATAGILHVAGGGPNGGGAFSGLTVSGAAYSATCPVVALHFGRLAPVALFSNLLALPLCATILIAGYGTVLFGDVPGLGEACRGLSTLGVRGLLAVADASASLPGAAFRVPRPSTALVVAYYASLLALLAVRASPGPGRARRCLSALRAIWLLALAVIHLGAPPVPGTGGVEAFLVDVGQGQSLLLRGPRGAGLLVDAGGSVDPRFDPGEREVVPLLSRLVGRRLETLIVSHGDLDHSGGVPAVLRELEVGELWLAPGWHRSPRLRQLAAVARERGAAIVLAERGVLARRAGVVLRILAPSRDGPGLGGNDGSVVLAAGPARSRILVPGDLEAAGERSLLSCGSSLRAQLLVLAHHGSRSATGSEFLARVRPRVALVSCGYRNRFAHPHADVVRRLAARRIPLWRTDRHGMLHLRADENGWRSVSQGR